MALVGSGLTACAPQDLCPGRRSTQVTGPLAPCWGLPSEQIFNCLSTPSDPNRLPTPSHPNFLPTPSNPNCLLTPSEYALQS